MATLTRPDGLGSAGALAWSRAVSEMKDRGDVMKADHAAVERYARAVDLSARCWEEIGEKLMSTGSMGQPTPHPLLDVALKADKHAEGFAKALGIEPVSRNAGKGRTGRPQERMVPHAQVSGEPPRVAPLRVVPKAG